MYITCKNETYVSSWSLVNNLTCQGIAVDKSYFLILLRHFYVCEMMQYLVRTMNFIGSKFLDCEILPKTELSSGLYVSFSTECTVT